MRFDVDQAFRRVADSIQCWIGLPEPDPLSSSWLGRAGYLPLQEACQLPLSDSPDFEFAGLAVDPTVREEAFLPDSLDNAIAKWQALLLDGALPPGYSVIEEGQQHGLVTFCGSQLIAQLELFGVWQSNAHAEFLSTSDEAHRRLFREVTQQLNTLFGTPLFSPWSRALLSRGFVSSCFPTLLWYGPGQRFQHLPGAMAAPFSCA